MTKPKKKTIEENNKKEDNTDGFISILFFLFTLYLGILGGIRILLKGISLDLKINLDQAFLNQIYGTILIGAEVLVGFYLVTIILVGILELNFYYSNNKQTKLRVLLRKFVLNTPIEIICGVLPLMGFVLIALFFYFHYILAIVLSIFYIITAIFTLCLKKRWKTLLSSILLNKPKRKVLEIGLMIGYLLVILSLLFISFNVILFNLAKFDINLDKELYLKNDDVYVTIYPKGIIKPIIDNVYYSNIFIPLNYKKDRVYGSAPIYSIINAKNLTDFPFNSYLTIEYHIPNYKFFRNNITQQILVPVLEINKTY